MDTKAKARLGGLILLATTVLSLILALVVGSWPITILSAIVIMTAAAGGFVWTLRYQQHQFTKYLKKFDINPERGHVNEANLCRMYHSGGQAQKDAAILICLSQKCSVDGAHTMFKKRPTCQEINQMVVQWFKGCKHPHR